MKKIIYTLLIVIILIHMAPAQGLCRKDGNLYNLFRKKTETRVYIPPIENVSGSAKADAKCLTQKLKDTLNNRKSIKFKVVETSEASDIIIDCDLVTFFWTENDPIDLIMGIYTVAYDVLTSESYAFQEVIFTVTDTEKNKVLWKEKLKIDVTKKGMTEDESIPLINKKTVKTFMRDCFSKRYSRPRQSL